MIDIRDEKVIWLHDGEKMQIEPWGENSFRVRVTKLPDFTGEDWALLKQPRIQPLITTQGNETLIQNGKLHLTVTKRGKLIFRNGQGCILLAEYLHDRHTSLAIDSRELAALPGGGFRASLKWNSNPNEKLFGMGQYQNGIFNLKGSFLELAQRNSQASVPFVCSSLGYGFLWNNPAVGRASFGMNMTQWEAVSTKEIDFWITAGDSPAEILSGYMTATGKPPVMPEHGLGFWQCKLRYQSQEELMNVAREYHRRGIPLDVIIADFFHWPVEGSWMFDPEYWPDPAAMVEELSAMGTRLMVSVWPTVSFYSPNYSEMRDKGYLIGSDRGTRMHIMCLDPASFADFTNPDACAYVWKKIKENYVSYGIKDFWLDEAEPEFLNYDFDNYRYYKGTAAEVGNEYPVRYTQTFYDGLKQEGETPVNLVRCAWAGSQRYGALVWSGDIASTFESFRNQVVCGLQMAMAGIPWWTTDIGGFYDGHVDDPKFRELLVRWFQYGAFCPVMRLHGDRNPHKKSIGTSGGGRIGSGADNEIWSFGEDNYQIMKRYIEIRNKMKPYLRETMDTASEKGCPVMRPLFYNFPNDEAAWEIKDQFMLGQDMLIAPVMEYGLRKRRVYLPSGTEWLAVNTRQRYTGGQWVEVDAPIEMIPVFVKADRPDLLEYFA